MPVNTSKTRNTFEKVYKIVNTIPYGKVATYGQVAALLGPGMPARIIGYALHALPPESSVPWHRVINSRGHISLTAAQNDNISLQQLLLENEGIKFITDGVLDLMQYLWHPEN
jgi:methylated-DNA-protein-cysteine methyltransferase-like protein